MEIYDYMTKNRKLKLEEYDDDGNLIDVKEFVGDDLFNFIHYQTNFNEALSVARKNDIDIFSKEQIKIIDKIITLSRLSHAYVESEKEIYWFTDAESKMFKNLFEKIPKQDLEFAIELANGNQGGFNTSLKSKYAFKKYSLFDALRFINSRDGIYYAVNNDGKRAYDFVNKPTKQQAKYQRIKNGRRTVFLNFSDWKEYIVSEDEL